MIRDYLHVMMMLYSRCDSTHNFLMCKNEVYGKCKVILPNLSSQREVLPQAIDIKRTENLKVMINELLKIFIKTINNYKELNLLTTED